MQKSEKMGGTLICELEDHATVWKKASGREKGGATKPPKKKIS